MVEESLGTQQAESGQARTWVGKMESLGSDFVDSFGKSRDDLW